MKEDVHVEFKELDRVKGTVPDSVSKAIVAFVNTEGGEIYIGIRDDGSVVGVVDTDDAMTRVSNVARDTILPDVTPFIQIRSVELEKKSVVKVTIAAGTERPYYLAKEGLKPKGVFVRRGSACIPLSETGIREMIMETSGKSYEKNRSLNQELTFQTLQDKMSARKLEFGRAQKLTLKMIGEDGLYNNLALLLSDQCVHTTKVAIYQGQDAPVLRDRKEFGGSILKQLDETYRFLDFYNKTNARFEGLRRIDRRDYPDEALREALLNSLVHRDYLFSGSTIINVFDNRIEFVSLGGLVRGISMDAVFMGVSQSRNPNLAAVFYRLGLVESCGTGVRKILRSYQDFEPSPKFQAAEGAFSVQLFNRNENVVNSVQTTPNEATARVVSSRPDDVKAAILAFAKAKGKVTRKEIEDAFGFGTTKAYEALKSLCNEGAILQQKNGRRTTYIPNLNAPARNPALK